MGRLIEAVVMFFVWMTFVIAQDLAGIRFGGVIPAFIMLGIAWWIGHGCHKLYTAKRQETADKKMLDEVIETGGKLTSPGTTKER